MLRLQIYGTFSATFSHLITENTFTMQPKQKFLENINITFPKRKWSHIYFKTLNSPQQYTLSEYIFRVKVDLQIVQMSKNIYSRKKLKYKAGELLYIVLIYENEKNKSFMLLENRWIYNPLK